MINGSRRRLAQVISVVVLLLLIQTAAHAESSEHGEQSLLEDVFELMQDAGVSR